MNLWNDRKRKKRMLEEKLFLEVEEKLEEIKGRRKKANKVGTS
jgi:hypothetical protein